jgi:hypothetical protein
MGGIGSGRRSLNYDEATKMANSVKESNNTVVQSLAALRSAREELRAQVERGLAVYAQWALDNDMLIDFRVTGTEIVLKVFRSFEREEKVMGRFDAMDNLLDDINLRPPASKNPSPSKGLRKVSKYRDIPGAARLGQVPFKSSVRPELPVKKEKKDENNNNI